MKTVSCQACGKATENSFTMTCEECKLDVLIKDAIDNHGWTKEMGESLKTKRGFSTSN